MASTPSTPISYLPEAQRLSSLDEVVAKVQSHASYAFGNGLREINIQYCFYLDGLSDFDFDPEATNSSRKYRDETLKRLHAALEPKIAQTVNRDKVKWFGVAVSTLGWDRGIVYFRGEQKFSKEGFFHNP